MTISERGKRLINQLIAKFNKLLSRKVYNNKNKDSKTREKKHKLKVKSLVKIEEGKNKESKKSIREVQVLKDRGSLIYLNKHTSNKK